MLPVNFVLVLYYQQLLHKKKVKYGATSIDDMHVQAAKAIKPNKAQLTKSPKGDSHI